MKITIELYKEDFPAPLKKYTHSVRKNIEERRKLWIKEINNLQGKYYIIQKAE